MKVRDGSNFSELHTSKQSSSSEECNTSCKAEFRRRAPLPKLGDFARVFKCFQNGDEQRSASIGKRPASIGNSVNSAVIEDDYPRTSRNKTVKLGDFGRIQSSILKNLPPEPSLLSTSDTFSTPLDTRVHSNSSLRSAYICQLCEDVTIQPERARNQCATDTVGRKFVSTALPTGIEKMRHMSVSSADAKASASALCSTDVGLLTPASTPPTPVSPVLHTKPQHTLVPNEISQGSSAQRQRCYPRTGRVLSYRSVKTEPPIPIIGELRTKEQQHESLCLKMIPVRAEDASTVARRPQTAANGVHVFLDMSNIHISFQYSLRSKYLIPDNARFSPLPSLNLEFLSELLVRGRHHVSLSAGCSMLPDHHEPRYVKELRALGYRVDLRERKLTLEPKAKGFSKQGSGESSSDELFTSKLPVRYVEDLVDETLQTRIAESVMECFQCQGTLVFATGDAKAAKYSDGFLAYAQRALRMGWNVEVVSWKCSLSSQWMDTRWMEQWGERFRIVTLDDYIEDLLIPEDII